MTILYLLIINLLPNAGKYSIIQLQVFFEVIPMASVVRKEIMPFVNLTCIRTNKFKTGCLSVNLLTKLNKSTASKNALLPRVLRRGTAIHPDIESLAAVLDELYGARIEPIVRKRGEVQSFGFYADFVDDDFITEGGNILERTADVMRDMLLAPKTLNGRLTTEYVDSERTNLIDDIRSDINDKRQYAVTRLIENMCAREAYGTPRYGTEAAARKITAAGLTKHYRDVLASSAVEIIYCGGADDKRVEIAVKHAFAGIPRGEIARDIGTDILIDRPTEKERVIIERFDVTQGKLAIGFRLGDIMLAPNYAAIIVFNAVFGASATSKLFMNVREKLSLCYYASSVTDRHKGIMVVSSGIEFSNYDRVLSEILKQLEAVKNGEVEPWELESARRAVVNSYLSVMDLQPAIESYFFDQTVTDLKCMPEDMAALVSVVTAKDIQKVAAGLRLDTIYFLDRKKEVQDEN